MAENIINALPRSGTGKGAARQLRLRGRVPGVFYFGSETNISFSVDSMELTRLMRNHHTLLNLIISGEEPRECVIREIQRDPVSDKFVHIDFLGIKSGQKLVIDVPLKLIGIPLGVKSDGGILQRGASSLTIECLPSKIPAEITVDVSNMKVGHSLYLESLVLEDIRLLGEPRLVLASVVAPTLVKDGPTQAAATVEPKADA